MQPSFRPDPNRQGGSVYGAGEEENARSECQLQLGLLLVDPDGRGPDAFLNATVLRNFPRRQNGKIYR